MGGYPEGAPCWADVSLSDLAAGKRFYGELLGWTFDEAADAAYGNYTTAYKDGRRVAAAADPGGAVFGLWQGQAHTGFELMRKPGSYCWTEVYTRDKDQADAFYESVFGYQGGDPGSPDEIGADFRTWSLPGTEPGPDGAIGGRSLMSDAFPAALPDHFLIYFSVEDCDAVAAVCTRLGGRVTAEPFDIPYGRMAVLNDNQGAAFAVLQGSGT
ncbi:VOC family protein [Streptomyces sp. NPDC001691]|uniref:VOC family protein n=1 Tax=Streptomyces sp. NPDC001691 TaxID=3364600 RepID=UPI003694C96A